MSRVSAILLAAFMLGTTPGMAPDVASAQQPDSAEPAAVRAWLFDALATAPTQEAGNAIAAQIWRFWFSQGPDAEATAIMGKAIERREQYDYAGAMVHLDELVKHAPDWAEAWNQRATILFYQEKYDRSLEDCHKVLALEPKHFGALAGMGVILMRQGRIKLGQKSIRQAVEIHPWISARNMLQKLPGQEL